MSDHGSPVDGQLDPPVDDGQEQDFMDEVAAADSDRDSDALSEIDENEFEDYDPETANIEDRPVEIDDDIARTLVAGKRKRAEDVMKKKPREGRREKKHRERNRDATLDEGSGGDLDKPRRAKKSALEAGSRPNKVQNEMVEADEDLTPEERRKRALNAALDAAMKKTSGSRRKRTDDIDLDEMMDEQLADLKVRMENACTADNAARDNGQPAIYKLKLLPEITAILNRNNVQHAILDPDTNFLQHVKFFLEPLNDGSLPAFNIQRDIFTALMRLNVEKESLLSSGIGKVVLFYTRSKKPEPSIKRMAEKLLGEWSRPILKRTDDYKKRQIETRQFDYQAAKLAQRQKQGSQFTLSQRPAQSARDATLARPGRDNQARMVNLPQSYSVAPKSTFDPSRVLDHRPLGATGLEAFRKMTQKGKKKAQG